MKPTTAVLSASLLTTSLFTAAAATYSDATGDFTGGSGFLDMTSVDVNNTATTLTFRITLAADPSPAGNNWATKLIGLDIGTGGGNINAAGGWGKDIQMSAGGLDFFIGNWLNNGSGNPAGATLYSWNGVAWTTVTSTGGANPFNLAASVDSSSVTVAFDFAALGLSAGNSFNFDVYSSTTGGDNVLDALSNNNSMSWNSAAFDTGASALSYTIAVIPEPSALALAGLGILLALRRGLL